MAVPATILNDTFAGSTAGSALASHTSDSGHSWTQAAGTFFMDSASPGGVYFGTAGQAFAGAAFPSGCLRVSATFKVFTNKNEFIGPAISDATNNGYTLVMDSASPQGFRLQKGGLVGGNGPHANLEVMDGYQFQPGEILVLTLQWIAATKLVSWYVSQGGAVIYHASQVDPGYTPTQYGLYAATAAGSTTTGYHCTQITATDPGSGFVVSSPAYLLSGAAATVTLAGSGTAWSGSPGFTSSAGTISGQSASSATAATFTLTAPAGSATAMITDPASNFVGFVPVAIPATDPHIYWSPGCWASTGSPRMTAVNCGAYFKTALTAPGRTAIRVVVDTTNLTSGDTNIRHFIENFANQSGTLKGFTTPPVGLMAGGTHVFTSYFQWYGGNTDNWATANPPAAAYNVVGIHAPGCTIASPTLRPNGEILIYGDSRCSGFSPFAGVASDGPSAPSFALAEFLGCELGNISFPGQGWTATTSYNEPPLFTPGNDVNSSWNKVYKGVPRTFPANPKYVIVLGYSINDANAGSSDALVTAAVQGFLPAIRGVIPATCWIIVIPSWEGSKAAAVQAGFNAYQAGTPDPLAVYLNVGATLPVEWTSAINYPTSITGSYLSTDGTHATEMLSSWMAACAAMAIRNATFVKSPVIGSAFIGR